ncbi:MAG: hypothetical protein AABX33_02470 [Nanoarchaeota archaeon]
MAKIHGLVYIAVGAFVSIASWKMNYEKLIFFFYAGLIFIFVGIVKLFIGLMKNKNIEQKTSQAIHYSGKRGLPPISHHHKNVKYCLRCGNSARLYDKFCGRCGAKLQ